MTVSSACRVRSAGESGTTSARSPAAPLRFTSGAAEMVRRAPERRSESVFAGTAGSRTDTEASSRTSRPASAAGSSTGTVSSLASGSVISSRDRSVTVGWPEST